MKEYISNPNYTNLSDTEMNDNKSNLILSADAKRSDDDNPTEEYQAFLTVGLMVKIHQIGHVLDRMTVLCEPGCKDHILFCFPDSIAV